MKRYLLFAGPTYDPANGWRSFLGSFDLIDEAANEYLRLKVEGSYTFDESTGKYNSNGCFDWYQIVDSKTEQIERS